jgi:hypothetical protein
MNPERTIKITHKASDGKMEQIDVRMLYCAASETGFQSLSGETMEVFAAVLEKDDAGKVVVKEAPRATDMNYLQLAIASIVAAYERDGEKPPVTSDDILYNATRKEVVEMIKAVMEMQAEWLFVPSAIESETDQQDGGGKKNA